MFGLDPRGWLHAGYDKARWLHGEAQGLNDKFNPMNFGDASNRPYAGVDEQGQVRGAIDNMTGWADQARGDYGRSMADFRGATDHLGRIMRGENSLAGEQLRQGLEQNIGGQMAMAAGARGGNQIAAARTAANNAARLGAGFSGQQATAGIQERNQAAATLGGLLNQNAGIAGGFAGQGYGNALQGELGLEQARGQRFNTFAQTPTEREKQMTFLAGLFPWSKL